METYVTETSDFNENSFYPCYFILTYGNSFSGGLFITISESLYWVFYISHKHDADSKLWLVVILLVEIVQLYTVIGLLYHLQFSLNFLGSFVGELLAYQIKCHSEGPLSIIKIISTLSYR